jgi:glycosyltransferase involved in cell wall biosynthesis
LRAVGKLDFVVVKGHDDDDSTNDHRVDDAYGVQRVIRLHRVESHSPWEKLRCGFDAKFMGYDGHIADTQDRLSLLRDLPKYDLVWIHALRTANSLGHWAWPRSVMDIDDIPSTFLQTVLTHSRGAAARLRASLRLHVAKRRERYLNDRFTVLSVCSISDRRYVGRSPKVHVIPNGFSKPESEPVRQTAQPPRIGFIGIFDYAPNVDSIRWFVEKCWPQVKQQVPEARFRVVGTGSDGPRRPQGCDVDALGWVENAADEIATWSAMVVPLRMGGGTRVKIAEGFSRKCPIVSTSLGAYGYAVENGQELLLADSADDFAAACVRVIRQPQEAAAMADRAWRQFMEHWTWDAIRPRIWAAAEDCLRAGA